MKNFSILIALIIAVLIPFAANAVVTSWDYTGGVLQPLASQSAAEVKFSHFTTTGSTQSTIANAVRLNGTLLDNDGDAGTSGQVLSSTGSGLNWVAAGTGDVSTTDIDTEAELETILTDVTNVFTNNDGALSDDDLSDNDTDDLSEGLSNLYFTNERAEDAAGGMFTGNTETLITATYQDIDGTLDLIVDGSLSNYTNDAGFLTAVTSADITNGEIVDADINASAAIGYSKLSLTNQLLEADLKAVDAPADEECLTYEVTTGDFEWQACGSGGGDLWSDAVDADIVPDTDSTRDLGSAASYFAEAYVDTIRLNLDMLVNPQEWAVERPDNTTVVSFLDEGYLTAGTSNAANYFIMANNTAGFPPSVTAAGSDTNIDINLIPKGTGELQNNGQEIIDESMISTGLTYAAGAVTADLGTSIDTSEIEADTITHADIADSDQADTKCLYLEDPTADDDLPSIWRNSTANDFLITEIWAESDQTVAFDLQVDDGTPADVNGTDITPAAGEAEDTTLSGDTTLAAGEELDLVITSVTSAPTWVSICWTGNWVD